jgi:hypothetical protein
LLSAFFDTNSPSIQRSFLSLKPFDAQDRIYKIISEVEASVGRLGQAPFLVQRLDRATLGCFTLKANLARRPRITP